MLEYLNLSWINSVSDETVQCILMSTKPPTGRSELTVLDYYGNPHTLSGLLHKGSGSLPKRPAGACEVDVGTRQ